MVQTGRVLQVSVSPGGVPKLPVERARVTRLGLEGDGRRERTVHGGPHRAVCLFSIEAIERLRAEGHPVEPGSTGENLTTAGIEWSLLPVGSRARVGDGVVLELASAVTPCATQRANFVDGRFSRISIALHPSDSRMYARVVEEGVVRPGDEIVVEPPAADSRAGDELILGRLDRAEAQSSLQLARAAADAGFELDIVADGELALSASHDLPGPAFNRAAGLARLPNLIPEAVAFFDRQGTPGWLLTDGPPWPGSVAEPGLVVFAASPEEVSHETALGGVSIRVLDPSEHSLWTRTQDEGRGGPHPTIAWAAVTPHLARRPHVRLLIAELGGEAVATAALYTHRGVGWLRAAVVAPKVRGRGIQRALIATRARLAAADGCDLVGAAAEPGTVSARNLGSTGFRMVGRRELHRHDPPVAAST